MRRVILGAIFVFLSLSVLCPVRRALYGRVGLRRIGAAIAGTKHCPQEAGQEGYRVWKRISLLIIALAAFSPAARSGALLTYSLTVDGVFKTVQGEKTFFSAAGTLVWEPSTGEVSFDALASTFETFSGEGTLVANPKRTAWALTTFVLGDTGQGEPVGTAILTGKFNRQGTLLKGKLKAAAPARLGAPPDGFVLAKAKLRATLLLVTPR